MSDAQLAAQQQAVEEASRNIMLELNLRQQALEKAVSHLYESDPYEVTKAAEVFLEFLQTGAAVAPSTGASNE
jgi:hypothetical protein